MEQYSQYSFWIWNNSPVCFQDIDYYMETGRECICEAQHYYWMVTTHESPQFTRHFLTIIYINGLYFQTEGSIFGTNWCLGHDVTGNQFLVIHINCLYVKQGKCLWGSRAQDSTSKKETYAFSLVMKSIPACHETTCPRRDGQHMTTDSWTVTWWLLQEFSQSLWIEQWPQEG